MGSHNKAGAWQLLPLHLCRNGPAAGLKTGCMAALALMFCMPASTTTINIVHPTHILAAQQLPHQNFGAC